MDASTTMLKISVVGHADKIGSDGYNQKLSEKRANAVKAYLISKGAPADLIAVSGKGEKDPLVTCQKTKGVVDCLKTNRRVEIEAHGEVNFVINN
jgi:OOP family OmpA-OmpF porin